MYLYDPFYSHWAEHKLNSLSIEPAVVSIGSMNVLSSNEYKLLNKSINQFNFALYESDPDLNKFETEIHSFGSQFGLKALDNHLCVNEDKICKIFDDSDQAKSFYIPYTNKPINWHTDGYYNNAQQKVYAFILHCAQPAFEGGVNDLMDQDQVFIHLMQENPLYIDALMDDKVMTIPENKKDGVVLRPETSTAIFKVINDQHDVLMRYSMRKKNIIFNQNSVTQDALACMDEFINSNSSPHSSLKLKAGQGLVCNNVLHKRTAFKDKIGLERLYYRARYYNRINITN